MAQKLVIRPTTLLNHNTTYQLNIESGAFKFIDDASSGTTGAKNPQQDNVVQFTTIPEENQTGS